MGVTISSENCSIDLGYGGFYNLRKKVAELTAEDIFEHYKHLSDAPYNEKEREKFFEEYDKKIVEIAEAHNDEINEILDFLYASDCNGEASVNECKKIYEVIKDYDDDILYGYWGRPDCAKFRDFKEIVKDCIDTNTSMKWY